MCVSPPRARSSEAQSVAQCARPAASSSPSAELARSPKKRYTTKKPAARQQLSQKHVTELNPTLPLEPPCTMQGLFQEPTCSACHLIEAQACYLVSTQAIRFVIPHSVLQAVRSGTFG